jgi:hypothetical protein
MCFHLDAAEAARMKSGVKLKGQNLRILTYKRTHIGDPDNQGRFGIYNCMGRVRKYGFDDVIGVGGIGPEPKRFGIDRKINWVGINPKRKHKNSIITFENFLLLDEHGPLLEKLAPNLSKRMYVKGARILLDDYTKVERSEAMAILKWSLKQKSKIKNTSLSKRGCHSRCRPISKRRTSC